MFLQRVETVKFDPSIKEHRMAVQAYMKRKAWGDSPFRFKHDPEYGSVADQVEWKLCEWYLAKEFDKAAKMERVIKDIKPGGQIRPFRRA
jgi:hypothetical protein